MRGFPRGSSQPEPRSELFGCMAGAGTIAGEIIDVPAAPWAAE
jgi:hypothetical protein